MDVVSYQPTRWVAVAFGMSFPGLDRFSLAHSRWCKITVLHGFFGRRSSTQRLGGCVAELRKVKNNVQD